jgi:hypothetical protein
LMSYIKLSFNQLVEGSTPSPRTNFVSKRAVPE